MSVREKVLQGKPVRVRPLAEAAGVSASGLYSLIGQGKIEAIRVGRNLVIPPHAAGPLIGITELGQQAA